MNQKKFLPALFILFFLASCEKDDDERQIDVNYNPVLNPANFENEITNEYFPLTPGTVYSYTGETSEGTETTEVTVLTEKRSVAGISCTVVRDVVKLNGQVIEDTYDWYAQDTEGNVWYLGEDVKNYENGKFVDNEGSFETGIDGAKAGIIMMVSPVLEMPYRQEYSFNIAEDWGKVIDNDLTITVAFGTFGNCIKTADWNALEPDAPVEYKYYAPGIGLIREEVAGSNEFAELINME